MPVIGIIGIMQSPNSVCSPLQGRNSPKIDNNGSCVHYLLAAALVVDVKQDRSATNRCHDALCGRCGGYCFGIGCFLTADLFAYAIRDKRAVSQGVIDRSGSDQIDESLRSDGSLHRRG